MTAGCLDPELDRAYRTSLSAFVETAAESDLLRAFDLGREALSSGVSLSQLAQAHWDETRRLLSQKERDVEMTLERAEAFHLEVASVHDMAIQGYRNAMSSLREEIEQRKEIAAELALQRDLLEQRVEERTRQLRLQADHLERANHDLEQVLHGLAHDLRTPLGNIDAISSWTLEDFAELLPVDAKENIGMVRQCAARMLALLDGIMTYAQSEHAIDSVSPVDVTALIEEAVAKVAPPSGFKIEICAGLPAIRTQRKSLCQVLVYLIDHAIKHHDKGTGLIQVDGQLLNEHLLLDISDDGPGIPREFQERVFKMFQKLCSKDDVEGPGLGLTIARRIIEHHGAQIGFRPKEGRGLTVHLQWPVEPIPID
jgi:signal transduction histidine kinase